jgi:hypothetical protein
MGPQSEGRSVGGRDGLRERSLPFRTGWPLLFAMLFSSRAAAPTEPIGSRELSNGGTARRMQTPSNPAESISFDDIDSDGDGVVSSQEFAAWQSRSQDRQDTASPPSPSPLDASPGLTTPDIMCKVLLQLDNSCAQDLSMIDPSATPGLLVGDVCVAECAGQAQCVDAAIEVSFLSPVASESDGTEASITVEGTACVDTGGARFDGDGGIIVEPHAGAYGNGGAFSASFWLAKDQGDVAVKDMPIHDGTRGGDMNHKVAAPMETILAHGSYDSGGTNRMLIALKRSDWLEAWELVVRRLKAGIFCTCRSSSLISPHLSCHTIRKVCHSSRLRA